MNHSFEKESTSAGPAIEYRNVYKRFQRTGAQALHGRHARMSGGRIKEREVFPSGGGLKEEAGFYAVKDLSASVRDGELITILGSSGCGKTTLLKMTNRLYEPDGGTILLFGEDIQKQDPVHLRRRMGYVIQQAGLFPHMTVEDNISVIPRLLKWEPEHCRERVTQLLVLVGLEPEQYRNRYPSQLSGGQQQRVGLARALAAKPRAIKTVEKGGRLVYLFSVGTTCYYSFVYTDSPAPDFSFTGMEFLPFSFGNKPVPKNVYFGAETAFQLSSWYNGNRHCGRCGGRMSVHPKNRCIRCTSCGNMDYPRVMPAVTIAVINGDKLLMIRYRPREEDGYAGTSLIAGFIEVGETIEDAVRREVMEEAGLKVSNIRYYKSQPWGFASNLMIGVICDLDGSDETAVHDTDEVAEAVWIPRDEIRVYDNGVSLTFEMIDRFKKGEI